MRAYSWALLAGRRGRNGPARDGRFHLARRFTWWRPSTWRRDNAVALCGAPVFRLELSDGPMRMPVATEQWCHGCRDGLARGGRSSTRAAARRRRRTEFRAVSTVVTGVLAVAAGAALGWFVLGPALTGWVLLQALASP